MWTSVWTASAETEFAKIKSTATCVSVFLDSQVPFANQVRTFFLLKISNMSFKLDKIFWQTFNIHSISSYPWIRSMFLYKYLFFIRWFPLSDRSQLFSKRLVIWVQLGCLATFLTHQRLLMSVFLRNHFFALSIRLDLYLYKINSTAFSLVSITLVNEEISIPSLSSTYVSGLLHSVVPSAM